MKVGEAINSNSIHRRPAMEFLLQRVQHSHGKLLRPDTEVGTRLQRLARFCGAWRKEAGPIDPLSVDPITPPTTDRRPELLYEDTGTALN